MWRLYVEHRNRPSGDHLERLVLVGAGDGAEQILRTLRASTESPYVPVAMVDDDHAKRNLRLSGVKVEGRIDDLVAVADRHRATAVLIAAPSAPSAFYRRVTALAEDGAILCLECSAAGPAGWLDAFADELDVIEDGDEWMYGLEP